MVDVSQPVTLSFIFQTVGVILVTSVALVFAIKFRGKKS
jgi:hypothetical protein